MIRDKSDLCEEGMESVKRGEAEKKEQVKERVIRKRS
jgi:hypothetical protein